MCTFCYYSFSILLYVPCTQSFRVVLSVYFYFIYLLYTFSGCKISANRTKYQIYLNISEVQPIFNLQSKLKLVQTERKAAETQGLRPEPPQILQ